MSEWLADFFVAGTPRSQGSLNINSQGKAHNDAELLRWRKTVWADAIVAWRHRPALAGPIFLGLDFFIRPRSKKVEHEPYTWAAENQRFDRDKLERAVMDSLTLAGVWRDDGYVVDGPVRKFYVWPGQPSGVHIKIKALDSSLALHLR